MTRTFRSLLVPALLLLSLFWPLPGWAAPIGASIALTNVLFDYQPVAKICLPRPPRSAGCRSCRC